MKKFDRFVIFFLMIVLSLIMVLLFQGDHVGVQVSEFIPDKGEQVGAYGPIGIRFAQEMDTHSVEENFVIVPATKGGFIWEGQTLWFYPHTPLARTQVYQVTIQSGARSDSGRELLDPITWIVEIREPDIVYLVLADTGGDLWRFVSQAKTFNVLTDTNGAVIEFAPSPSGNSIAYVTNNNAGGSDLWIMDRDGLNQTELLSCGSDRCSQPAWRIGGEIIAYVRETYTPESELFQPGRIWTINTQTGQTNPLYQQDHVYGHSPSFSPDGQKIAFYDTTQSAIRILDLVTSQEVLLSSALQGVGHWSAERHAMIFTDLVPSVLEPEVSVFIADLEDQSITQVFSIIESTDFGQPRWSPDGEWVAASLRPINAGISKALWVLSLGDKQSFPIVDQPSATFSAYRWDAWGDRLVYQRLSLGSSTPLTSIWLWDWETRSSQLLVENGVRPGWLP
jgi:Tol biopolymer transport system component